MSSQEIIDSDSERFTWLACNGCDMIGLTDIHALASEFAEKRGRTEPNTDDYGDAMRLAIDLAEYARIDETMDKESAA